MRQFQFLFSLVQRAGKNSIPLILASICSGGLQAGLLYSINEAVAALTLTGSIPLLIFLAFIGSLAGIWVCLTMTMGISSRIARELVTGFETRITEKISKASYRHFVSIEQGKMYEAVTGGKDIINESAIMLPMFICSFTMMLCCLTFLAFISFVGLGAVVLAMGLGAIIFLYAGKRLISSLFAYKDAVTPFQSSLKDVILGFIELKMNEQKRLQFFERKIRPLSQDVFAKRKLVDRFRVQNSVQFSLIVFLPVGVLLFILPQTGLVSLEQCIKMVAITLFGTIPLMGLLAFLPMAARAAYIVQELEDFEQSLTLLSDTGNEVPQKSAFHSVQIAFASYSYPTHVDIDPFELQVNNFFLEKGELVFLTGGNGSGKSTFMRLLAGLEPFSRGEISVNGLPAQQTAPATYRSYFSTLFPDFHLFDGLYDVSSDAEKVNSLLSRLGLDKKVQFDAVTGTFSTIALSSGQRKRLGLVCALMEDRPVLLLDEVAADLDQKFRDFFYRTLLPELRQQGKTALVVSHDERYFDVADRILTMQYGQLSSSTVQAHGNTQ